MRAPRVVSRSCLAIIVVAASCGGEPRRDIAVESAKAAAPPSTVEIYRLLGSEPFWGVAITPTEIRFTSPENMDGIGFPFTAPDQEGTVRRYASSIASPEAHTIEITLEPKECSDGMSDKTYAFQATVKLDGRALSGCATREAGPSGPP